MRQNSARIVAVALTLFSAVALGVLLIGAGGSKTRAVTKGKCAWTKEKAAAALKEVKQRHPEFIKLTPKKDGPVFTAIAEVEAGSSVDFAIVLPTNASVSALALFAKNGPDTTTNPSDWQPCETSGLYRCNPAPAGYWGYGPISTDAGPAEQF